MNHKKFRIDVPTLTWEETLEEMDSLFHSGELTIASRGGDNGPFKLSETIILDIKPKPRFVELTRALKVPERAEKMCQHPYNMMCWLYISLTSKASSHGKHNDISDVFHWQQQGVTEFTIWEDGERITYTLTPGDCLFIPMGVYHDTLPLTPRCGLSFALIPKDTDGGRTQEEKDDIISRYADKKDYTNVI
jgi:mannose-6-phosphate isomerase-like protein (cupin superfamily)